MRDDTHRIRKNMFAPKKKKLVKKKTSTKSVEKPVEAEKEQ